MSNTFPQLPEFVYTTKLMRLTQFLKRCVSAVAVKCPYNNIDEGDTVFLKSCVSASVTVVELHQGGSATNTQQGYPVQFFFFLKTAFMFWLLFLN